VPGLEGAEGRSTVNGVNVEAVGRQPSAVSFADRLASTSDFSHYCRMEKTQTLDATVRLRVLHAFLAGETPTVATVARNLREPATAIAESFDRLAAGRAIVLVPRTHEIMMAAPFAGRPTDFQVTVGARRYNANCIWDALGIPAMLGGTNADIETVCEDCAAPLRLSIRDRKVAGDGIVHFAVPAARWWEDIGFT